MFSSDSLDKSLKVHLSLRALGMKTMEMIEVGRCVLLLFIMVAACGMSKLRTMRAATFPAWSFEHWVWEDESTQESAKALVAGYLERDIPVGAIIIDSPWSTVRARSNLILTSFPTPKR